jgi:hypothetical protein
LAERSHQARANRCPDTRGDKPVRTIIRFLDTVARSVEGSRNRAMAGLGNIFENFTRLTFIEVSRDISLSNDSTQLALLIHDRDTPDLLPAHGLHGLMDVITLMAARGIPGHNLGYRGGVRMFSLSKDTDCQVAISHNADDTALGI